MRHFLTLLDWSGAEIRRLLADAAKAKAKRKNAKGIKSLANRVVALIFEKPSLRTRVSFETAIAQLGGTSLFLVGQEVGLGTRETIPDCARTLSEYVDAVVLRTFRHATIEEFAAYARCPVINALSDCYHPCQALGDLLTMQEIFTTLQGRTVAFVGDGNNVARSLAIGCGKLGMRFVLACPQSYGFDQAFLELYQSHIPDSELIICHDPREAVTSADVIYTDVWASMGQENERERRLKQFRSYQVNEELLALAPPHARIMHCLPAHRGEEITSEVLESERSVVFQQAGNRLYVQKALLQWLFSDKKSSPAAKNRERSAHR
ncbi:MAG: ornithine carbamoyltransferase, catabolic [Gemmatales bacterium]|nr:MAG: ornithine carbamoyltransferase, catabolic [Gemmatales bacterium]